MPSKKMYALYKELNDSPVFLSRTGKWTASYNDIRWYAYRKYAEEKLHRYPEAQLTQSNRDYDVCDYGGQKRTRG